MATVYSVTQVNSYIKNMFAQDFALNRISIQGEVSNCKYHSSGHIYFTLKDSGGTLSAIMFASRRGGLSFSLKDGQQVVVSGSIEVYEKGGSYQLYAQTIKQAGIGDLYEKYLKLKEKLEDMGLFAQEYKRPIPRFAGTIGIVTASTGAALQDIVNIATRRNPYIRLVLCPAQVQGNGAAESIVHSIRTLDNYGVDIIIAGRGGGSLEDLWAFNEEKVARAIFDCGTPIISAVGHETDYTIADYVADLRAPTPSAAAELATFDMAQFMNELDGRVELLGRAMEDRIADMRNAVERAELRLTRLSPGYRLNECRARAEECRLRLNMLIKTGISDSRYKLGIRSERLKGLSPLEKLSSGYAWISDTDEKHIRRRTDLTKGQEIYIRFADGKAGAQITQIGDNQNG